MFPKWGLKLSGRPHVFPVSVWLAASCYSQQANNASPGFRV
uniref:Uncharacterized protein n=1 Tax=Anguilla anguilla TaxID=7936 RepID=A0A0E9TV65_ANGAN